MTASVLVISEDPVGRHMGGNAIRAYELARVLGKHAEVTLAAPQSDGMASCVAQVPFDREDPHALREQLHGVDVVVALPQSPAITAQLRRSRARIVFDLYDPKPLQVLEAFAAAPAITRRYWSTIALDHVMAALGLGDYLICASERQRDLWIGALLASGLIGPGLYRADPTLRSLIDVVPFGVPEEQPISRGPGPYERFAALAQPVEIVLWNGGLWNWLDPVCAVDAIAQVLERRPLARLVFMGRAPFEQRQATAAREARDRAQQLGLLDSVVFFNDGWVAYEERAAWLLASDCAVSLHVDHLETRFSFRTRLLDCLWAAVPVVCTEGDELGDRVEREQLGTTVAPGDSAAVADAIAGILERGRASYRDALGHAARENLWPTVAAPLVRYVENPPDVRRDHRARGIATRGRWVRAMGTRVARSLVRAGKRLN
jgi:glycosyltransferase involved in cell wall biosynthesis